MTDLLYEIALSLVPGIGSRNAKALIAYCGSSKAIFSTPKAQLLKIPGIGPATVKSICSSKTLERAEQELHFINKYKVNASFYLDDDYPIRLKQCPDCPLVLYTKGQGNLDAHRMVAVVGTRSMTEYGKELCTDFISSLSQNNISIVSGLAYGVDITAHKMAIKNYLPTYAVLAHGLDRIYPYHHREIAKEMMLNGGLVSEFMSNTNPDKQNFPQRNRIIAGLCDATIIVEGKEKGGALITAYYANDYSRDVFAFPGNVNQENSKGCNNLIKRDQAALIDNASDFLKAMAWEEIQIVNKKDTSLFANLNEDEKRIIRYLKIEKEMNLDQLSVHLGYDSAKLSTDLLALEFSGKVRTLPGNRVRLN